MEVLGAITAVAGTVLATAKLVKVIRESVVGGKVKPSATPQIVYAVPSQQPPMIEEFQDPDDGDGDMYGLEDDNDVNFQFQQNLYYHYSHHQYQPTTTATLPRYDTNAVASPSGSFRVPPPTYDLTNASPYDDIVEASPPYAFAAALSVTSNTNTAPSRSYTSSTSSSSSHSYNTNNATSISDDTADTNHDSIAVNWIDTRLQSMFGTSHIPERFLVEQRDGVFRTRCKISIGSRGVVPIGTECTSYAASTLDTVIVTWVDKRLHDRIGPYDIPERHLARLRDGVFRTTTKLTIKDRGTVPKGAICKLLYA